MGFNLNLNLESIKLNNLINDINGQTNVSLKEVSGVSNNSFNDDISSLRNGNRTETIDLSAIDDNTNSSDLSISQERPYNLGGEEINNTENLTNTNNGLGDSNSLDNLQSPNSPLDNNQLSNPSLGEQNTNPFEQNSNQSIDGSNIDLSSTSPNNPNGSINPDGLSTGMSDFNNNGLDGTNNDIDVPVDLNASQANQENPEVDRPESLEVDYSSIIGNDHSYDNVDTYNQEVAGLNELQNTLDIVNILRSDVLNELNSYNSLLDLLYAQIDTNSGSTNRTTTTIVEEYLNARNNNSEDYLEIKKEIDAIVSRYTDFDNYEDFIAYYNQLVVYRENLDATAYSLENLIKEQPYIDIQNSEDYRNFEVPETTIDIDISSETITLTTGDVTSYSTTFTGNQDPVQFVLEARRQSGGNIRIIGIDNLVELENLITASERDPELLRMYEYLYYTQGIDAANQYLSDMEDKINQIVGLINAENTLSMLETIDENELSAFLSNHIIIHGKGLGDGLESFFAGLAAWTDSNPVYSVQDYESLYLLKLLQENSELYGDFLAGSYELGQGVGNMIPSVVLSTLLTPAAGMAALGVSAGGNSYRSARLEGYSQVQSIIYGIISGGSEAIFERYLGGLPGLSDIQVTGISTLLKSMGKEGLEEVYQDLMDYAVRGLIFQDWPDNFTAEDIKQFIADEFKTWYMGALTAGEMDVAQLSINKTKSLSDIVDTRNPSNSVENNPTQITEPTGELNNDIISEPSNPLENNPTQVTEPTEALKAPSMNTSNSSNSIENNITQITEQNINNAQDQLRKIENERIWVDKITNTPYSEDINGIHFRASSEIGLKNLKTYYNNVINNYNNLNANYFLEVIRKSNNIFITDIVNENMGTGLSFNSRDIVYIDEKTIRRNQFNIFFHEIGHLFDIFIRKNNLTSNIRQTVEEIRKNLTLHQKQEIVTRYLNDFKLEQKRIMNNYSDEYIKSRIINSNMEISDKLIKETKYEFASNEMYNNGYAAVSDIIHALFFKDTSFVNDISFAHPSDYLEENNSFMVYKEIIADISDLYNTGHLDMLLKYLPEGYVNDFVNTYEDMTGIVALKRNIDYYSNYQINKYGEANFINSLLAYLDVNSVYYHNLTVFTTDGELRNYISSLSDVALMRYLTTPEIVEKVLTIIANNKNLGNFNLNNNLNALLTNPNQKTLFTKDFSSYQFFIETLMSNTNWKYMVSSYLLNNEVVTPTERLDTTPIKEENIFLPAEDIEVENTVELNTKPTPEENIFLPAEDIEVEEKKSFLETAGDLEETTDSTPDVPEVEKKKSLLELYNELLEQDENLEETTNSTPDVPEVEEKKSFLETAGDLEEITDSTPDVPEVERKKSFLEQIEDGIIDETPEINLGTLELEKKTELNTNSIEEMKKIKEEYLKVMDLMSTLQRNIDSITNLSTEKFIQFFENDITKFILSLSESEYDAVQNYCGEAYNGINGYLRDIYANYNSHYADLISNIDSAIIKYGGLEEDTTLYRTLFPSKIDTNTDLGKFLRYINLSNETQLFAALKALEGQTITDDGYLSTSYVPSGTRGGLIEMEIKAPKGIPGINASLLSPNILENEFIIGRGSELQIKSVSQYVNEDGETRIKIEVEAINTNPDYESGTTNSNRTIMDTMIEEMKKERTEVLKYAERYFNSNIKGTEEGRGLSFYEFMREPSDNPYLRRLYIEDIKSGYITNDISFEEFLKEHPNTIPNSVKMYYDLTIKIDFLEEMR